MSKFFVFSMDMYYPYGGADDFKAAFDTVAEATEYANSLSKPYGHWHIADADMNIIAGQSDRGDDDE